MHTHVHAYTHMHLHAHTLSCRYVLYQQGEKYGISYEVSETKNNLKKYQDPFAKK